jgi:hypothetical protein
VEGHDRDRAQRQHPQGHADFAKDQESGFLRRQVLRHLNAVGGPLRPELEY